MNPSAASTANSGNARRDQELREAGGDCAVRALAAAAAPEDEEADAVGAVDAAGRLT
jgi:hypothetical protein